MKQKLFLFLIVVASSTFCASGVNKKELIRQVRQCEFVDVPTLCQQTAAFSCEIIDGKLVLECLDTKIVTPEDLALSLIYRATVHVEEHSLEALLNEYDPDKELAKNLKVSSDGGETVNTLVNLACTSNNQHAARVLIGEFLVDEVASLSLDDPRGLSSAMEVDEF